MSEKCMSPCKVSGKAINMIAEIAAAVECYRILLEGLDGIRLRKINHIRTIKGTTAIEGNTLTEDQITVILVGKRVVGSKREIGEVKGAHEAYEAIESFTPYSIDDLLKAHILMTKGLVDRTGKFRNCNVGVMKAVPDITMAELANATGLSITGVKKNIRKLKDANLIRRIGPDKGGH